MKVGLIGVGSVAQIMHLPYLVEVPDIDLRAISDPGSNVDEAFKREPEHPR